MQDAINVLIIVLLVAFGVKESIKHMRGEGGCCGGSSSKPKKKRLHGKEVHRYNIRVEGMHCKHCVNAVTNAINEIEGASAKVSLKKKCAIVRCDREVTIGQIISQIEKRGYSAFKIT